MESHFDSDFFAGNRQKLRELFTGTAPIVVSANGLLQRGADSTFSYAQDASFWYLTGINEPDVILVIDRDKEYLIVAPRSASREAFDGAVDTEGLSRRSGITTVMQSEEGWNELGSRLKRVKHAATLAMPPTYIEQYGMYTNPARATLIRKMQECNPDLEILDLNPHMARLRMIKQPAELEAIRQAIEITVKSFKRATTKTKRANYHFEYEIEAELTKGFRGQGAAGHSFDPIIASGQRACTMHSISNNGALSSDDLIIIDVGAEVEHYAADITRTISLKEPSRRQFNVHKAVLEAQEFALSLLKPGVMLQDYEQQVEHFLGEKLRELGLLKTITHEGIRKYCPHATSHFLGLNVHDIGEYDRPLEAGVVLTVEPGIYIAEEGIGVRIEDDVLITDRGHTVLSKGLSREL